MLSTPRHARRPPQPYYRANSTEPIHGSARVGCVRGDDLDRLDLELHERLRSGSTEAFEELYRRYAPGAYGLALRVTGQELLAQEVVHDAFLARWRGAGG